MQLTNILDDDAEDWICIYCFIVFCLCILQFCNLTCLHWGGGHQCDVGYVSKDNIFRTFDLFGCYDHLTFIYFGKKVCSISIMMMLDFIVNSWLFEKFINRMYTEVKFSFYPRSSFIHENWLLSWLMWGQSMSFFIRNIRYMLNIVTIKFWSLNTTIDFFFITALSFDLFFICFV